MSLASDLGEKLAGDARLFILKELDCQNDGRLNVLLIQRVLDTRYGINRSRDWVETQLHKLAELGAVDLLEASLSVAQINRIGRDHLAGRSRIAGITRPSEVE